MPDIGLLNHAVTSTWGDRVTVKRGNMDFRIDGVFIEGYRDTPAGNADIEQSDPYFSFRAREYARTGATQGDLIEHAGVDYSIVSDPLEDGGDWVRVPVRKYA